MAPAAATSSLFVADRPNTSRIQTALSGVGRRWAFVHCLISSIVMACRGCSWSLLDFGALTADAQRLRDFLISHHIVAGIYFCDVCNAECRVDDRRQLFCCDRQETVKLHGGIPRSLKGTHSQKAW